MDISNADSDGHANSYTDGHTPSHGPSETYTHARKRRRLMPASIVKKFVHGFCMALLFLTATAGKAPAQNEIITVPIILGDYYVWAYTETFQDHSEIYGWSTAGVDALGWGLIVTTQDYSGLFFVNLAGIAKTVYPVTQLLWSSDSQVHQRAWIALGTHALTLVSLELLGRPALSIQSMGPRHDGLGLAYAFKF